MKSHVLHVLKTGEFSSVHPISTSAVIKTY